MQFVWNKEANEFVNKKVKALEKKIKQADERRYFQAFLRWSATQSFADDYDPKLDIVEIFKAQGCATLEAFFGGVYRPVVTLLLGEDEPKFLAYVQKMMNFPYTAGYYRRTYRSRDPQLYLIQALAVLRDWWLNRLVGLSPLKLATFAPLSELEQAVSQRTGWAAQFCALLDSGDQEAIALVKDAILGDNQQGKLSYAMVQAVLRSDNWELKRLLGDLLLAARLQEGLRQVIVENMDESDGETFRYFFKLIMDNDLLRYSSIKRAMGTWTGLFNEEAPERMSKKVYALIAQALLDDAAAAAMLHSEDNVEVYLALWRLAFDDVDEALAAARAIIDEGVSHKVQLVAYFLHSVENKELRNDLAKEVLLRYPDDLKMAACYLPHYLPSLNLHFINQKQQEEIKQESQARSWISYGYRNPDHQLSDFFADEAEGQAHFAMLNGWLELLDKKEITIDPCIFPWYAVSLQREAVAEKLLGVAALLGDDYIDRACPYFTELDTYKRDDFLYGVIGRPRTATQRQTLLKALADRSEMARTAAYHCLALQKLDRDDYGMIEAMLKYKTGDLRQNVIKLLLTQPEDDLLAALERLLADKSAEKRLGALDILLNLQRTNPALYQKAVPLAQKIAKPTAKEKVLLEQLTDGGDGEVYTKANGFGLYDVQITGDLAQVMAQCPLGEEKVLAESAEKASLLSSIKAGLGKLLGKGQADSVFGVSAEDVFACFQKLHQLVADHAHDQYRDFWGDDQLLGDKFIRVVSYEQSREEKLDNMPFPHLWRQFYQEEINSQPLMMALGCCAFFDYDSDYYRYNRDSREKEQMVARWLGFDWTPWAKKTRQMPYQAQVYSIAHFLELEYQDKAWLSAFAEGVLDKLRRQALAEDAYVKGGLLSDTRIVGYLLKSLSWHDEATFRRYFAIEYGYVLADLQAIVGEQNDQAQVYGNTCDGYFDVREMAYACQLAILPREDLYRYLLGNGKALAAAVSLTSPVAKPPQDETKVYPPEVMTLLREVTERITKRLLDMELKRGDSTTEATELVRSIPVVFGSEILVRILTALGNETLDRASYYYWGGENKRSALSQLLRKCQPLPEDAQEVFNARLKNSEISDKRLVEAALYNNHWLELIEGYLKWPGLVSTCYYFIAHMNESSDEQKKAIFAKYTPIDAEDLQLGAFDIDWFWDAYRTIGEARFDQVYAAAKYITDGTKHSRARKFADAVLGRLDIAQTKAQVADKRNKDLLMAYCLIPLDKNNPKDLLERYQYVQQFQKESKQFGAQRRASEGKAAEIALENLARNAGYDDVTRLTWQMETALIQELTPYFAPREVGDCTLSIAIDDTGAAEIVCLKKDKPLKALPAKLKKDPYVVELKEVHKQLVNQYRRSRAMLEDAMAQGTVFYASELNALLANPIIAPLLRDLVFIAKDAHGYFSRNLLTAANGQTTKLTAKSKLRLAHPFDLYKLGVWSEYQRDLFDRQIRQPFKQVFRELYTKTADELGRADSLRYAGNQIQPRKTAALLKTRRWVADYENGLQKVYYKENIIVQLYAMADWFSPADVEAPTLEWVAFSDRKTFKPKLIDEIPDILFSEIMRDVDLAVSVAHAGGVDPEASHSTVEMRRAIVEFTLPLFKLTNVTFAGNFAIIDGALGQYHVHLGSGVVHLQGKGALNILPVHSQQRGKLFLPFVDDDPKTAEILSKILLLAEDTKIKDPFILEQLR